MTWDLLALLALKLTVLFGLAWVGTALMRRASAAFRHLIWTSVLAASFVLPALAWMIPAWKVPVVTRTVSVIQAPVATEPPPTVSGTQEAPVRPSPAPVSPASDAIPNPAEPQANSATESAPVNWSWIALGIWLTGSMILILRLALGLWRLRRMRLAARPLEFPVHSPGSPRACRIEFLESASSNSMPLTWGWRTPRILLPSGFETWSPDRWQLVLAHEAAHAERRDWPVQILGELARAVYWFHPLVWVALWHLRQESERAADDRVLASGFDGPGYAHHLIEIARLHQNPFGTSATTLAMARPSTFERRLTAMLNPILNRAPLSRRQLGWSLVALMTILFPLAALAMAQEIRGIVMEVGTTQPVTEAQVHISKDAPIQLGEFRMAHSDPVAELTTDAQGRFQFSPEELGKYIITVDKEGFAAPTSGFLSKYGVRQANVVLNETNPEASVRLALSRTGQVSGRFIDADTGEPIAGMRVLLSAPYYFRGVMMSGGSPYRMTTSDDGGFTFSGFQPGDYAIATKPFVDRDHNYMSEIAADFKESDLEVVDQGYPSAFFPGGPSLDRALLFSVPSGGVLDLGTFRIRKVNLYDARIRIADDNCPVGTPAVVSLYTSDALGRTYSAGNFTGSCGGSFLIQNLEAGNYRVYARTRPNEENVPYRLMADIELPIEAENMDVKMFLQPGVTLEGRITPAEGAGDLDLQTVTPQLNIIHRMMTAVDLKAPGVAENGRFSQDDMRPATYEVVVNRLPPGAYISEVRYKGIAQPRLQFDFAGDGLLEIEVDTRSATLSGTVGDRDGPIPKATVAVVPWPVPRPDERRLRVPLLETDEEGRFTTSLPPSDYRIFALVQEDAYRVDMPGFIERLAARGAKLTVARSGSYSLTLEPEDPSR